jgi:hypothetical protein
VYVQVLCTKSKNLSNKMKELPEAALIVVATFVGFVTGIILLACILVIWSRCVRIPRKSIQKLKPQERYTPLDPHPSFEFVRVEEKSISLANEKPFKFESGPPSPQPITPAEVIEKRQDLYRCIQPFEPRKNDDTKLEIDDQVNIYMVLYF